MASYEERVETYYQESARTLAEWLVETENTLQFILDTLNWAANEPDMARESDVQNFCRNLLDDYTK